MNHKGRRAFLCHFITSNFKTFFSRFGQLLQVIQIGENGSCDNGDYSEQRYPCDRLTIEEHTDCKGNNG
jgi:hypothetical protein